jgi:REP element-mobilizing transposase RayT
MAVYMFTYHAYRSWMPDRGRGYVKDGEILPSDPQMAEWYRRDAKDDAVRFDATQQQMMLSAVFEICERRGWRLRCYSAEPEHVHVVISWRGYQDWRQVRDRISNLLSTFLGKLAGERGRRWFVRRPSRRRVRDRGHYDYLLAKYLPGHRGVFWREGAAKPSPLSQWLVDVE